MPAMGSTPMRRQTGSKSSRRHPFVHIRGLVEKAIAGMARSYNKETSPSGISRLSFLGLGPGSEHGLHQGRQRDGEKHPPKTP